MSELDVCAQWLITICNVIGMWLLTGTGRRQTWGYALCLSAQPAWFYTIFYNELYGILPLTIYFTFVWLRGTYNHCIRS